MFLLCSIPQLPVDCETNHEILDIFLSKVKLTYSQLCQLNPSIHEWCMQCSNVNFSLTTSKAPTNTVIVLFLFYVGTQSKIPTNNIRCCMIECEVFHLHTKTLSNTILFSLRLIQSSAGDSSGFGCSPPHFSGSPPCRAGNPVVRDVLFSRLGSPAGMATHHPKPIVAPSYRPSPGVRVEGFECSARGFECTARDTRCHVSALA